MGKGFFGKLAEKADKALEAVEEKASEIKDAVSVKRYTIRIGEYIYEDQTLEEIGERCISRGVVEVVKDEKKD